MQVTLSRISGSEILRAGSRQKICGRSWPSSSEMLGRIDLKNPRGFLVYAANAGSFMVACFQGFLPTAKLTKITPSDHTSFCCVL